jgi:hypothetical protein
LVLGKGSESNFDSFVEEVRGQWRLMWKDRVDDRVRAEGVACQDYDKLFVERGTVVLATRNFKLLTLRGILEQHRVVNADRFLPGDPHAGGWRKFGRAHAYKRLQDGSEFKAEGEKPRQMKKGGRGWLHV